MTAAIILVATLILAALGLVLYANSAGKAKAVVSQKDAEDKGREAINEICNKNNGLSDADLDNWLHQRSNKNS